MAVIHHQATLDVHIEPVIKDVINALRLIKDAHDLIPDWHTRERARLRRAFRRVLRSLNKNTVLRMDGQTLTESFKILEADW